MKIKPAKEAYALATRQEFDFMEKLMIRKIIRRLNTLINEQAKKGALSLTDKSFFYEDKNSHQYTDREVKMALKICEAFAEKGYSTKFELVEGRSWRDTYDVIEFEIEWDL